MTMPLDCPLAPALAQRMRAARDDLTARWLERIAARVTVAANQLFPSDELLDHVPILIDGIAAYVENPADDVGADAPVIAKAMELGDMRHAQGFDAYQILKEYEILGSVLFHFLATTVDKVDVPCTNAELLQCAHRVFHAVALIQQATATQFLRQQHSRVRDREERLRGFNSMVTHELKNRLGAAIGAVALQKESWLDEEARSRFLNITAENLNGMNQVLDELLALSRLENQRQQRNVRLSEAVAEVRRRLRELARERDVLVHVDDPLPAIEVNAAAMELCLTNYISNAVKYSDPAKPERWVRVSARLQLEGPDGQAPGELIVQVADNGLGVPPDAQQHLFDRFFRAHADTAKGVDGTGLGLSIVRETVRQLGGRVWSEPNEGGGSVFALAIPSRRGREATTDSPPGT